MTDYREQLLECMSEKPCRASDFDYACLGGLHMNWDVQPAYSDELGDLIEEGKVEFESDARGIITYRLKLA